MPLYEYECQQCRKHTEKRQKFSDVEITVCPKCGGVLQRVITAPSIAFKGGGWFKDGYGSVKPTASTESGGGDGKAAGEINASGDGKAPVDSKASADGKASGKSTGDSGSGDSSASKETAPSSPGVSPSPAPATSAASPEKP